jgi:hypothetical protein
VPLPGDVAGPEVAISGAGRAVAFQAPIVFAASAEVSPTVLAASTSRAPLVDVRHAVDTLPKKGRKTTFAGPVEPGGEPLTSHIQGLAGYKDVFFLTHSDADEASGRILVLDRVGTPGVVTEFRLPTFSTSGPSFFHAGGCQMLGDVLAVPSETGKNASVVAFFDVSDPRQIREFNGMQRVLRPDRDAAAVGITTITRGGQTVWLLAVYDSGTVDFYESPDFPGGALFEPRFRCKVRDKDHQHLLLFTDQANRVVAIGLNRGAIVFTDTLVIYDVDVATQSMKPDPDRHISTGGGTRLRWGASLEVVGDRLALHCTERDYGDRCVINTLRPMTGSLSAVAASPGFKRVSKGVAKAAKGRRKGPSRKPKRASR